MNELISKLEEPLLEEVKAIKERVRIGLATIVIIDGGVGQGKTTLGVQLADAIEGEEIDLELQLAIGGEEFTRKVTECYREKKKVIIYDEAGDFNKRGSLTKLNQTLNRIIQTFRAFRIVIIMILPSVGTLDNNLFLNKAAQMLLHVSQRDEKRGVYKTYSLSRMMVIRAKMQKLIIPDQAYGYVPFNSRGHFYDLPEERRHQLDLISTKGKLHAIEKASTKLEGLVGVNEIRQRFGMTQSNVSIFFRKNGIKPVKRIGKKYYYHESVMKIFEEKRNKKFTAES